MCKTILFDLDGTLTESGEGIMKSVQYALEKMGKPEKDQKKLQVFIGPPLIEQFMEYSGFDKDTAKIAVQYYRERYSEIGIFENRLYPGIVDMLKELRSKGYLLAVASSKPEYFVNQILNRFGLSGYFNEVVGSTMDGKLTNKAEVIDEALNRLKKKESRDKVIIVGDKEHDVEGARKVGISCVAVAYGYGTIEELKTANPDKIVNTVNELKDILISK